MTNGSVQMSAKANLPMALAAMAMLATPALAGNGNGKAPKQTGPAHIANCPPGLA